jgi:hypothetical protein
VIQAMNRICLLLLLAIISCGSGQAGQPPRDAAPANPPITAPPIAPSPTIQIATVGNFKLSLAGCQLTYVGAGLAGKLEIAAATVRRRRTRESARGTG